MTEEPKGRARGGVARARALTAGRRKEIAERAAAERWNPVLRATHGSPDHPLKIGDIEIPCYVLEDGTRVLSQRGMVAGLGMAYGSGQGGADRLTGFALGKGMSPFINNEMLALIRNPIRFTHSGGGGTAFGYPATLLADICDAILEARKSNALQRQQEHLAQQSEVLVRGFARVGIVALVDEATGYQDIRPADALQQYLEKIIRKELAVWAKKFPDEFYQNIYRLRNWPWPGMKKNRYSAVAGYTRDLVYERIAPGLLEELEIKSPKNEKGNRENKLHQWLTDDLGNPMLAKHLQSLITLQQLAIANGWGWGKFINTVNQVLPKKGSTLELNLPEPEQ